jgi:hypothetical protein
MDHKEQELVNQRFIKVYEALESKGEIKKHKRGASKVAFIKKIFGQSNVQFLNRYLGKGKEVGNINPNHIKKLIEHYNVSKTYMNSGTGPMFENESIPKGELEVQEFKNSKEIKHFSEFSVLASVAESFSSSEEVLEGEIPGLEGKFYSFKVEGDSMSPTFEPGDLLLCRELSESEIKNDKIYVVIAGSSVMVKRVRKLHSKNKKTNRYRLYSDNYLNHLPVEREDLGRFLEVLYHVRKL